MSRRHDISTEAVARRWLAGETILALAIDLETSEETIKRRLRKARVEFPDLPWAERTNTPSRSSVRDYREMKDGVPGSSAMRPGSIIRSRFSR